MNPKIKVVGGGLAGVEAAYQLLKCGYAVDMYEMRPKKTTPAHKTAGLAELVCSNSLKSLDVGTAQGALKEEMKLLDSIVLKCAMIAKVPAGGALAVDREIFSQEIEKILNSFDNFNVIREEVVEIEDDMIIATGPLTSDTLTQKIIEVTGSESLKFYDAVAPIISASSIDMSIAFKSARYGKGDPDYINCPMNKEEYYDFVKELTNAETVMLKEFEKGDVFEACMPVEVMAKRGEDTLRFGPLRPVGIYDENGKRAYAVVQLRKEDNYDNLVNLVGFQTNLTFPEQKRVFTMIPGLKDAEFVRYGVMHRNTYINSPSCLNENFTIKNRKNLYFAGQLTGVEGYLESAMSGILAGINMACAIEGKDAFIPPEDTLSGSLVRYVTGMIGEFQPMHVSFALLPPLEEKIKNKSERKLAYAKRAINSMKNYILERGE